MCLVSFGFSLSETMNPKNRADELNRLWNAEAVKEAIELYKSASKQFLANRDFENAFRCSIEIFELNLMSNNIPEAEKTMLNWLEIQKSRRDFSSESQAYSNLAMLYLKANKPQKAESYVKKALLMAEESGDDFSLGLANLAAGEVDNINRKIDEMIGVQKKSLEYFRKINNQSYEAKLLTYLSYSYSMNNNSELAISSGNSAIEIQRNLNNRRGLALALIAQGDANQRIGRWQDAFQSLKEAQTLFSSDLDFADKAILYTKLGVHYETFGDMINAFNYFNEARSLYERGGDRIGFTELSIVLGQILMQNGDFDNAIIYLDKGKLESEKINDVWSSALAYERLGQVFYKKNSYDKAIYNLKKALNLISKEKNVRFREASVQFNLGKTYQSLKDYDSALYYFSLAEKTNRRVNNILGQSENLCNIATIKTIQNKVADAKKIVEECLLLTDKITDQTANSKLKRIYFSNVFDRYELYINLLMKMSKDSLSENYTIEALQIAEKSRARFMLENLSLAEANFTKDAAPETVRREKEIRVLINAKADKLTDLLSRNAEKNETDKISGEISELENQLEDIKAELKQNSPIYSAIKNPAPFDVGEFQQNVLDDDSLLLEFSFGKDESYLWLIGKTEVSSYILPPREGIESKIETLRGLLASRERLKDEPIEAYQTRVKKAEADYWTTANELSRDLFGQVAGKFGEKRLIVVPDGKLGYFPVSALPLPDSNKNEPILLTNEIVYQPSASTLSILTNSGKQNNPTSKSLLIFSDPVFTEKDSRLSAKKEDDLSNQTASGENFRFVESLNSLVRLGASKTEADSIIEILGNSNADSFTGFAANRQRLLDVNAAEYKILHFATHGLIDENRSELSGIVLSRFDESGNKLDEFFRLHDIYAMNLNSDLVVLSACGTATGKEIRGEGLMSLNNAFLSVGAKTVMASLWKVEDQATLELMKDFYAAMANENLTPSQALRKAQIKMWRSDRYRSPFYWAAFTMQGDYRNVPDIAKSSGVWKYFLPVSLILCLGAYFGIRIIRRRNHK